MESKENTYEDVKKERNFLLLLFFLFFCCFARKSLTSTSLFLLLLLLLRFFLSTGKSSHSLFFSLSFSRLPSCLTALLFLSILGSSFYRRWEILLGSFLYVCQTNKKKEEEEEEDAALVHSSIRIGQFAFSQLFFYREKKIEREREKEKDFLFSFFSQHCN